MKVQVRFVEILEGVREVEADSLEAIVKEIEAAQEEAGAYQVKPFETQTMYAEIIVDESVVQTIRFC